MEVEQKQQPLIQKTPERGSGPVQNGSRENSRVNQTTTEGVSQDSDITIREGEDALIIEWKEVKNAESYILHYERPRIAEKDDRNTQNPYCELKNYVYNWKSGEKVIIRIMAIDREKHKECVGSKQEYVIGGETVPQEAKLSNKEDEPHKSLILAWQKAGKDPITYEVDVFEKDNPSVIWTEKTSDTSIIIVNLKHLTEYYCAVKCNYKEGDGKFVYSNVVKTHNLPDERSNARYSVHAMLNPGNRAREIVVSWEGPQKRMDISHFEVSLNYEGEDGVKTQRVEFEQRPWKVKFGNLKSDTEYKAFVTTVFERKNRSTTESELVRTDPAQRTPGFEIKTKGKPVIRISKREKGDDVYGTFGWNHSDLGIDGNNYKIVPAESRLTLDGKRLEFGDSQVKEIKLKRGKSYSFTVIAHYCDLDTEKDYDAQATETLTIEYGEPSIDAVKWKEKTVVVFWSKAKGAQNHILTITNENGEEVKCQNVEQSPTTITSKELAYGGTYNFGLEARDDGIEIKNVERSFLIGGKEAVTKVVAEKNEENPRRSVIVSWQAPSRTPRGYRLLSVVRPTQQA